LDIGTPVKHFYRLTASDTGIDFLPVFYLPTPDFKTETVMSSEAALSNPRIFYGWFVVSAAFAVTFVGFGCAYTFSAFVESLQRDFGA
jgi:hypothetical protein